MRNNYIRLLVMLFFTALLAGCGGSTTKEHFIREDVSFDFIQRIAVLPFQNNTKEKYVNERARDIAITQILSLGISDVVDKGIVDSVMREEAMDPNTALDLINLNRLGQRLNVQAFLIGVIDDVGDVHRGSQKFPQIAMTLRLVDTKASVVLWQASGRRSSESSMGRMFGTNPGDSFHVTMKLLHDLLSTMPANK